MNIMNKVKTERFGEFCVKNLLYYFFLYDYRAADFND